MELRCPACNYSLTRRASEVCPECGGVFTEEELIAHARASNHPHPRADLVFHGCAIVACLPVAAFCLLVGAIFFEPFAFGIGAVLTAVCVWLMFSARRTARRRCVMRGDE